MRLLKRFRRYLLSVLAGIGALGILGTLGGLGVLALLGVIPCMPCTAASPNPPSTVQGVLKPVVFQRVVKNRDVIAYAVLHPEKGNPPETKVTKTNKKNQRSVPSAERDYFFYTTMLVRTSLSTARTLLTHYDQYSKLVPFVERSQFNPAQKELEIEGGIWSFKLHSWIRFKKEEANRIEFEVSRGHFAGMTGELLLEDFGEKGTLVYFTGRHQSQNWPPAFVVERGAEIVLEVTGKKMRSWIEENPLEASAAPTVGKGGKGS